MALFSTALLSALLVGASASQIVRRHGEEQDDVSMYLNSDGDAVQVIREAANVPPNFESCGEDFTFGVADSSLCHENHTGLAQLILDSGLCLQAATLTGASANHQNFHVEQTCATLTGASANNSAPCAKDRHPKGCFEGPCLDGAGAPESGTTCMFYNNIGDMPLHPVGTPVCSRPKYKKGTPDTNGVGADCQGDFVTATAAWSYAVIMDEPRCREVAECMGHAVGQPFDHGTGANFSKHDEFPNGCFISSVPEENGKVYFNHNKTGYGEPRAPKGTPLCNVTQTEKCTAAGCSVVAA